MFSLNNGDLLLPIHKRSLPSKKVLVNCGVLFCRYELGTTVSAINASLGSVEAPKNVMTDEAITAYEERLVKQAQEESLRFQVCVPFPFASKSLLYFIGSGNKHRRKKN